MKQNINREDIGLKSNSLVWSAGINVGSHSNVYDMLYKKEFKRWKIKVILN